MQMRWLCFCSPTLSFSLSLPQSLRNATNEENSTWKFSRLFTSGSRSQNEYNFFNEQCHEINTMSRTYIMFALKQCHAIMQSSKIIQCSKAIQCSEVIQCFEIVHCLHLLTDSAIMRVCFRIQWFFNLKIFLYWNICAKSKNVLTFFRIVSLVSFRSSDFFQLGSKKKQRIKENYFISNCVTCPL